MSQDTIIGSDIVRDAFEKLNGDIAELFAYYTAIAAGSGVLVSSTDTSIGYLNGKLVAGNFITLTVGNAGGDETLTIGCGLPVITAADALKPIRVNAAGDAYEVNSAEVGDVIIRLTSIVPSGCLEQDGSAINRTTYANLYAILGTTYGAGDGSTTYNLPDLRGYTLRGWDHGAGVDPDAATRTDRGDGTTGDYVGTKQADAFKLHSHTTQTYYHPSTNLIIASGTAVGADTAASGTDATGGNETRMINMNVMFCIKY